MANTKIPKLNAVSSVKGTNQMPNVIFIDSKNGNVVALNPYMVVVHKIADLFPTLNFTKDYFMLGDSWALLTKPFTNIELNHNVIIVTYPNGTGHSIELLDPVVSGVGSYYPDYLKVMGPLKGSKGYIAIDTKHLNTCVNAMGVNNCPLKMEFCRGNIISLQLVSSQVKKATRFEESVRAVFMPMAIF